jgi:hypothetical protein
VSAIGRGAQNPRSGVRRMAQPFSPRPRSSSTQTRCPRPFVEGGSRTCLPDVRGPTADVRLGSASQPR